MPIVFPFPAEPSFSLSLSCPKPGPGSWRGELMEGGRGFRAARAPKVRAGETGLVSGVAKENQVPCLLKRGVK